MSSAIDVLAPGFFTSVQDAGRLGFAHLGVPRAGAVDIASLWLANRLVGNEDNAAGLEITLQGATLRFRCCTRIALAGAPIDASLDGDWVPHGQTLAVAAGQVLTLGKVSSGLRAYLAIAGGLDVPMVLGSRSTDSVAMLGPAPLRAGDCLPLGKAPAIVWRYLRASSTTDDAAPLRFIRGPHQDYFSAASWQHLSGQSWRVASESNRSGVRLGGGVIPRIDRELPSEGMLNGAIQVPPDGRPIVLLGNHGTTGGYPVLGVVIAADIGRLAQARPGQLLCFREVTLAQAQALYRQQQDHYRQQVVEGDPQLLHWRALLQLATASSCLKIMKIKTVDGWLSLKK